MKHLEIAPAVCAALAKSADELSAMTLGAFCDLAYDKGFDVRTNSWPKANGEGRLIVTMNAESRPIVNIAT